MNYNDIKSQIDEINAKIADFEGQIDSKVDVIYEKYKYIFDLLEGDGKLLAEQYAKYFEEIKKQTKEENDAIIRLYEQRKAIETKAFEEIDECNTRHYKRRKKKLEDSLKTEEELLDEHYEVNKKLLEGNKEALKRLEEKYNKDKQEIEKKRLEEEKRLKEQASQNFMGGFNLFTSGINQIVGALKKAEQDILNSYGKADQEAVNYGRAIGMTSEKVDELRGNVAKFMVDNNMAMSYNLRTDEMIKLAGNYSREIGRAVSLTHEQMENMAQLNLIMGEGKAVKFTAAFDKFGLSVESAALIAEDMFNDANRKGISFEQISENFLNNIELAQQYTFENGVEGLKKMAESATAVKWNMQQTAAFADKVSNIEGAIKTGAQLSVLGGPFAQFSNPMGMLYESLNDMEGLQDRILGMFGGLGQWDNKKGMVDISAFDKQRIRAASSAMGLNYGDVMNTIHQQGRRNKILENIKNLGFDEDTQELIANTAQLDENGEAYITTADGEKKYVKDGLSNEDKEGLITKSKSDSETLREIAINGKSLLEFKEAVEKERLNELTNKLNELNAGKTLEGMYELMGQMQKYIIMIQVATLAIQVLVGTIQAAKGIGQMVGARGGIGGAIGNTSVGAVGKVGLRQTLAGTPGVWGKTKALGRWAGGNMAKYGGAAIGISALGYVGSSLMDAQSQKLRANGNHDDADKVNLGSGALNGVAQGVAIGSMFGGYGMAAGAIIGGLIGLGSASAENKKLEMQRKEEEYNKQVEKEYFEFIEQEKEDARFDFVRRTNLKLNGDYEPDFIRELIRGKNYLNSYHKNMLYENNDGDVWEQLKPIYAHGGIIKGSSHAEGGMNVIDNQTGHIVAEVEGDEGIIPKDVMRRFGTVDNLINSAMRPLQPMGELLKVNSNNNSSINSSLNVGGSASVNVGGSIQLSMPGGQTYNIADDPAAMRMIGDSVMRHIMTANQQIFNKTEFYRKM